MSDYYIDIFLFVLMMIDVGFNGCNYPNTPSYIMISLALLERYLIKTVRTPISIEMKSIEVRNQRPENTSILV